MLDIQFASRMDGVTGSAIRDIFHIISQPGVISFAGGNPSADYLEPERVAQLTEAALQENGKAILQYGATEGYPPFKQSLCRFLDEQLALPGITPEQILPTTGSTQAIQLIIEALINPGDVALVEAPTFLGTLQAMQLFQTDIKPIPMDEEGLDPDALEASIQKYAPKLIYTIPTFQNPTGRTLSLERRRRVAELAAKYHVVVLEDDPYRNMRYSGDALPPIKAFDKEGWVVYCTSFSKLISPGLRVGAAVVTDPTLMRKIVICNQSSSTHTCNLTQAIVDQYLRSGLLPAHVEQFCAGYRARIDAMLSELAGWENARYTHPEGGMFVWCALREGLNLQTLLPTAAKNGVAYVPGTHFYPEKGTNLHTMRLNFTNASVENIHMGMQLLKTVIENA